MREEDDEKTIKRQGELGPRGGVIRGRNRRERRVVLGVEDNKQNQRSDIASRDPYETRSGSKSAYSKSRMT